MTDDITAQPVPQKNPDTSASIAVKWLNSKLAEIEKLTCLDALTIFGPILESVDHQVRLAIENLPKRRKGSLVIIDTNGRNRRGRRTNCNHAQALL